MSGLDYRSIIISYIRFKLVSACNLRIYKEFIYSFNIFCASTAIIPKPLLHKGNLKILILRLHPRPELGFLGLGSGNSGTSVVFFFFLSSGVSNVWPKPETTAVLCDGPP